MLEDGLVLSAYLNITLRSACKLTYLEIQNEILDSVLQVFRKQVILEVSQTDYLTVIWDESTDVSGQTQ